MNRLTVGILLSFVVILSVTALYYTPDPLSSTTNCQYKSACGSKPDCAQKAKACGSKPSCAQKGNACDSKPGCAQKGKACDSKPGCAQKAKACGLDCTKPCCAEKKGI
jgi:hypothetical protein